MNQYVFGAICLAVLIAFGSFYLTSDLGGNSHFDKAGENWKRKRAVIISKEKLLNHLSQFLSHYNNRVTAVQAYQETCAQSSNRAIKFRMTPMNLKSVAALGHKSRLTPENIR